MALRLTFSPSGRPLYNGEYVGSDGQPCQQREFELPFVRNRFSNPIGRLLGSGGAPIRQIREVTQTKIVIESNDVRFLRANPKVTIITKGHPSVGWPKINRAHRWVVDLADDDDPNNAQISNLQLFHPTVTANIIWHPRVFEGIVIGPSPGSIDQLLAAAAVLAPHIAPAIPPAIPPAGRRAHSAGSGSDDINAAGPSRGFAEDARRA